MGQSATAYLCFGVALEEDAIPRWEEGDPEEGPAWMRYMGKREGGIEIVDTCNDGVPQCIVAIAGTVQSADWTEAKCIKVPAEKADERAEWVARIGEFVARWKLTKKVSKRTHAKFGAGWLLAARFA